MRRTEASARAIERASSDPTASKPANEVERSAEEPVERKGRDRGECGPAKHAPDAVPSVTQALRRIRRTARESKKERFTALLHHINPELLEAELFALKKRAAPGVDGVMWRDYEQNLKANLEDLHARVHRGRIGRSRRGGSIRHLGSYSTPAAGLGWPLNSCPTMSGQPSIGTSVSLIGLRKIWPCSTKTSRRTQSRAPRSTDR